MSPCTSSGKYKIKMVECPICMDTREDTIKLECDHELCRSCAKECVRLYKRCPMCRQDVSNSFTMKGLRRCGNCREIGHNVRSCPNNHRRPLQTRTYACSICHRTGHNSRTCPNSRVSRENICTRMVRRFRIAFS